MVYRAKYIVYSHKDPSFDEISGISLVLTPWKQNVILMSMCSVGPLR